MVENVDYIRYVHRGSEIKDFRQFFNAQNSIVPGYKYSDEKEYQGNIKGLLEFSVDGVSNFQNVMHSYPIDQRDGEWENALASNSISFVEDLFPGTVLFLPISKVGPRIASITLTEAQTDYYSFDTFFLEKQFELNHNPLYTPKIRLGRKGNIVSQVSQSLSVWLIKKANPQARVGESIIPEMIDITNSIHTVTTNVGGNGGNFTINLSPGFLRQGTVVAFSGIKDILKDRSAEVYRSISENDIVFIRFESLNNEPDRDVVPDIINETDIPNKVYDMIGLVDSVNEEYSPSDLSVTIQGRDLVKLLIDDENYFFPLLFASGQDSSFNTQLKSERIIKRIFSSGKIENTFIYSMRSVEKTLLFIFSQLANLGVIPEDYDPFSSYIDKNGEDRRSWIVDVTEDRVVNREKANGLWQIIKLQIDDGVRDRYLADPSIARPDGSILNQMKKICQEPFVEFMTDTFGDMFYLIARKPPFDYSSVKSWINNSMILDIREEDIVSQNLSFENQAYTWFQINVNGAFVGGKKMALSYLPIVYFPELADIYGSRKMDIQHNYIPYKAYFGHKGVESYGNVKREVIRDLVFVIESHIYLPFTRRGSITLNGDRRIKRGSWVYNGFTKEICYVDSVSNSISISDTSIDRTTTLQVSRCMMLEHVDRYFSIFQSDFVRSELERQLMAQMETSSSEYTNFTKSGISLENLNFFLNRKQFQNNG